MENVKKTFKETFLNASPPLLSGPETDKMLELIPKQKLTMIVRLARVLKRIGETERYKHLPKKYAFPSADIEKITRILGKHKGTWLVENDIAEIAQYIQRRFEHTPRGAQMLQSRSLDREIDRQKSTKPLDLTLLLSSFSLGMHMAAKSNKHKLKRIPWQLICDFLTEQKIINTSDVHIAGAELRDRMRKMTEDKLKAAYSSCIEIFSAPADVAPSEKVDLWVFAIKDTFPTWQEIAPRCNK
ncbi:MAG: hypothetical protein M0Z71_00885 [Nitrospiraceae bacterium]|nr:hypothetical protein [Nitrospiraceae bacterium]